MSGDDELWCTDRLGAKRMVSRSAQRFGWLAVAMAAVVAAEDGVVDPAGRVSLSVGSPSVLEGGLPGR